MPNALQKAHMRSKHSQTHCPFPQAIEIATHAGDCTVEVGAFCRGSEAPFARKVWTALLPHHSLQQSHTQKASRETEPDALCRILGAGHTCHVKLTLHDNLRKDATMPRVKQAAKQSRTTQAAAVTAVGVAGLGLSLTGSAFAYTIPTADIPRSDNISPNQRFVLGEEEMADVSLATFYLFDKENAGSDMQLAAVVVRRGCGGCRGCRGCRGCGVGWRGCGGCAGCGGCCARWGRCRWC